jgi:putative nucleotidyltransferase with HDIG domain
VDKHRINCFLVLKFIIQIFKIKLKMITREQALEILKTHVKQENLLQHCYSVEAGMRAYARKYGEDEEVWGIAGLLHDIDYEEFPETHPNAKTREWLSAYDIPEEVIYAIESHGFDIEHYPRKSLIDKALHAVDSISGIIIAAALVRPDKLNGMEANSVKKKIKDKSFAAKMDRSRMTLGCEELGVEMTDHITLMIEALQGISKDLGL